MSKSKNMISTCYTSMECNSCKLIKKRKFSTGDVVFSTSEDCSECDGKMLITKIFGIIMD